MDQSKEVGKAGFLEWANMCFSWAGVTREMERGKLVLGEKVYGGGFDAGGGDAATKISQEKEFVNMEGHGRVTVFVAIVDGGKFADGDVVTGFLFYFADGGGAGGIAERVQRPSSRSCTSRMRSRSKTAVRISIFGVA